MPITLQNLNFNSSSGSIIMSNTATIHIPQTMWTEWNQLYRHEQNEHGHRFYSVTTSGTAAHAPLIDLVGTVVLSTNTATSSALFDPQGFALTTNAIYVGSNNIILNPGEYRGAAETGEERRRRITRINKRTTAEQRARQLLLIALDRDQRRDLARYDYFYTNVGPRRYKIAKGRSGNVHLVDREGNELVRYCAHPSEMVPDYDTMLAQLLTLRHNEAGFLAIANVHWRRGEERIFTQPRLDVPVNMAA